MTVPIDDRRWLDPAVPVNERVAALLDEMTTEEKLAQLTGVWVEVSDTGDVAPTEHQFSEPLPPWDELTRPGLGQVARVFGTGPVEPATGAHVLARTQKALVDGSRLGIPAIAHEECLTGLAAWRATVFPTPLAWGAAFDPDLVRRMSTEIGTLMRSVGIHHGLAPVLDVSRDPRWGRTEETIGEDPYLVGTIGAAYTRGLEDAGIVATLKHFAGYSASLAGRNHAPVSMGPRTFADVVLLPFEMALTAGARSVMQSNAAVDGVPPAADPWLLTTLLREEWGFEGLVVSDYFGVSFLEDKEGVAGSLGEAAVLALRAGVDVELPTVRCYGAPLAAEVVRDPALMELVDRSVTRVLRLKAELGLLDQDWTPTPAALRSDASIDFDPPAHRQLARELAERSIVLLSNSGTLPLAAGQRIAVTGPCANDPLCMMGCYSFPNHVMSLHPDADLPAGVDAPTVVDAIRAELDREASYTLGCPVREPDETFIAAAVADARDAGFCIAVVGDRSALFGHGTTGEGCDAGSLALPGSQQQLLDALVAAEVPLVVVVMSGRPYALGHVVDAAEAVVQVFLPGEEGAGAIAGVLSGRVNPSGRLPIQIPATPDGQPAGYLAPKLGGHNEISAADPRPRFPFGHGLSYTTFGYSDLRVDDRPVGQVAVSVPTDGFIRVSCAVRNTGDRVGTDVVQLYLHDPVASVARPVQQLAGFARVELDPGAAAQVTFDFHLDRAAYTGRDLRRIVEQGRLELRLGPSSSDLPLTATVDVYGPTREVGHRRVLFTPVRVSPLGNAGGSTPRKATSSQAGQP